MKKLLCLILVLGLSALILSGCGGAVETSDRTAAPTAGVSEVIESGIAAADSAREVQEDYAAPLLQCRKSRKTEKKAVRLLRQ